MGLLDSQIVASIYMKAFPSRIFKEMNGVTLVSITHTEEKNDIKIAM